MLGKARNEFKRTTDDFRETWTREVNFESQEKQVETELITESSIQRETISMKSKIVAPEIKEVSQADFQESLSSQEISVPKKSDDSPNDKRDWL